jgi:hypothetical protein
VDEVFGMHSPGGGQVMPDGTLPSPGGWNRFALEIDDLGSFVEKLRQRGVRFRNDIISGVGGKQILLDDPSGNPVELSNPPSLRPGFHPALVNFSSATGTCMPV